MVATALVEAFAVAHKQASGAVNHVVDEVLLFYTRFQSVAKFVPTRENFLPIHEIAVGKDTDDDYELNFIAEPDPETVLNALMPRYLETIVFNAMLQSVTSEHASRRMAMKGATDAAGRMNKSLKKVYNRARQESITKELLDIIGGASAVS
jgi:F-type H+-transporting ATPase subunit gamma